MIRRVSQFLRAVLPLGPSEQAELRRVRAEVLGLRDLVQPLAAPPPEAPAPRLEAACPATQRSAESHPKSNAEAWAAWAMGRDQPPESRPTRPCMVVIPPEARRPRARQGTLRDMR